MTAQVQLSAYKQFATTTYSKKNLSILHTEAEGEPEQMMMNASDYSSILSAILVPKPASSAAVNASIAAVTYAMTWVHRVYGEIFTDEQNTLATVLENILAVPLQFGIAATQLANYTIADIPGAIDVIGSFPLPDDMATMAVGGSSSQRLSIQAWTGWAFIAADAIVLLVLLAGIFSILRQRMPLPDSTGLAEIDTLIEAGNIVCLQKETEVNFGELPIIVGTEKFNNYSNALRPWRMKYKS
jgi:hypothetical protein